jgi:mRNA interferase MazF
MVINYVPDRGDIIWISFNPQSGKEQAGHRPALVLSNKEYNKRIGLLIACPITSKEKGYPFEVKIKTNEISGAILADHVKSLDWKERDASFITKAPELIIENVVILINTIIK